MPLSTPVKKGIDKFNVARRTIQKMTVNKPLEAILVLLILVNLIISLRIILGIFIIFYFLDRWEIKKYVLKSNEDTITCSDEQTTK